MPTPVLIGSPNTLHGLVTDFSEQAWELVDAFWPGALTLVARHQPSLQWDLGDTRGTVAVRMPLHPVAIELLTEVGPMAVSSANLTGHPAAVVPYRFASKKNGPPRPDDEGQPECITIIGRLFSDDLVLSVAHAYQEATPWHRKHPEL